MRWQTWKLNISLTGLFWHSGRSPSEQIIDAMADLRQRGQFPDEAGASQATALREAGCPPLP